MTQHRVLVTDKRQVVLSGKLHESCAGNQAGDVPALPRTDPHDRKELVRFLKSIDRDTEPFLNVNITLKACGPQ